MNGSNREPMSTVVAKGCLCDQSIERKGRECWESTQLGKKREERRREEEEGEKWNPPGERKERESSTQIFINHQNLYNTISN